MYTLLFFLSLACALAAPLSSAQNQTKKGIYWVLAGDSTTAPNGGWGAAFLNTTVAPGSSGRNFGHPGATTNSFRDGGDWNRVLKEVEAQKSSYDVWVTIQFGHNDLKRSSNISRDTYEANIRRFVQEVKLVGGKTVLFTPLTQRIFPSGASNVTEPFKEFNQAVYVVQAKATSRYIDLNRASRDYVNAIGKENAAKYNYRKGDTTHINGHGAVVFSRMIADLLEKSYCTEIGHSLNKNANLTALIQAGKFA